MALGPLSQPGASARLPDAPTSISATAVSGGQATVSFVASTNPGKGSGNYVVTSSPGSFTASGASSPITVTGLTTGTAYIFTVVKQSGSGISSATSGASGSITAFVPPTFGTQTGASTATAPDTSATGISNVYTTTGTLSYSLGANAAFYDYSRISGTAVTPSGNSLTGLAENTSHEWRVRTTNTSSTFALTTRVTPNGSTTTVAVEYGTSGSYGSSAGSVSIGAGISEVTSSWNLGSSTSATIYWRATATYAGGASVQTTGTISREVSVYNGNSTGVFITYTSRTYTNDASSMSVTKPSYGANIPFEFWITGGGGGGGNTSAALGYGGGGGGAITIVQYASGLAHTSGNITISRGAGAAAGGTGGTTSLSYSGGTYTAAGGNPGTGNFQGGSSGNGNAGHLGSGITGGGGGGVAGAATNINGGSGNTFVQHSGGGPGFYYDGFSSYGYGVYIYSAEGNSGAGGKGAGGSGGTGFFNISYVGPARN